MEASAYACDASDPASVDALVAYACSLGTVRTVILNVSSMSAYMLPAERTPYAL